MAHSTPPSRSPKTSFSELSSAQENRPSTSTGANSNTQRKQDEIALLHADKRTTSARFKARFHGRDDQALQGDETQQVERANLDRLPVELLPAVVEGLPEHGPHLTSIARVNKTLYLKTAGLVNYKVARAMLAEHKLASEFVQNAERYCGDPETVNFVRDSLSRAREGLSQNQNEYLRVLDAHVRLIGEHVVFLIDDDGDFSRILEGIDFCVEELVKIEFKKTAKEESYPEKAVEAKLNIAESLLWRIDGILERARDERALAISEKENLLARIKAVIADLSQLASDKETDGEDVPTRGLTPGHAHFKARLRRLTDVFQRLLQKLRKPNREAMSGYRGLVATEMKSILNLPDSIPIAGTDQGVVRSILKSLDLNLESVDFEALDTQVNDLKNDDLKSAFLKSVASIKQRRRDEEIYLDAHRAMTAFLQKVLPADESRMDYIEATINEAGLRVGRARELTQEERHILRTMIESLEDPRLRKEADALLNGKTALQILGEWFGSLFRYV